MATSKKSREASKPRRGPKEAGHYQAPEEESDSTIDIDPDSMETTARGPVLHDMDTAFDDADIEGDGMGGYDLDEGDGDVEWDSIPPRGGGKSPDK